MFNHVYREGHTKIGRQILLEQKHDKVAARKFWMQEGISEMRLDKFWKMVWHDIYDRKIMMCLWLIAHRALPVGTWGKGPNVDPRCTACVQIESPIVYGNVAKQWMYGEGHYVCFAMPLVRSPSTEDMLVGTVLRMMWQNTIAHAMLSTKGRMARFS